MNIPEYYFLWRTEGRMLWGSGWYDRGLDFPGVFHPETKNAETEYEAAMD